MEGAMYKTRRIFAPTVRSGSRVWGRHSPTRMTEWTKHFQALKICGHGSILAFAVSVQHSKMSFIEPHSTFTVWQAQCKTQVAPARSRRSHRTQFLPLFCSGVCLAHSLSGRGRGSRYRSRTAYGGFKVRV